jgi:hypothetical protein
MPSSANQRNFEFSDDLDSPSSTEERPLFGRSALGDAGTERVARIEMPRFDRQVYAATSRRAGRINASAISEEEHAALLLERQALLDKKFDGELSRHEENRLTYVRWSLDRIEDAKYGASLDQLEDITSRYEYFASDVARLFKQLSSMTKRK